LNHLNRDSGIPLDSIGSAIALDIKLKRARGVLELQRGFNKLKGKEAREAAREMQRVLTA
jgi:hypothetical protein